MPNIPDDIFTEPEDFSPDTLANLGPLRRLAGVWESDLGVDAIAARAGFGSAATLRHHFAHRLSTTPQAYRATFRTRAA